MDTGIGVAPVDTGSIGVDPVDIYKKREGVIVDFLWHLVEAVKDLPTHEVYVFQVS